MSIKNKWRAIAAQNARCFSKLLSIQYIYYFRAYQIGSGTEDKSFAENSGNYRSQTSRQTRVIMWKL